MSTPDIVITLLAGLVIIGGMMLVVNAWQDYLAQKDAERFKRELAAMHQAFLEKVAEIDRKREEALATLEQQRKANDIRRHLDNR